MSYEGYVQFLCEYGHKGSRDCYEEKTTGCSYCSGKIVWRNTVDLTNGSRCEIYITDEQWASFPEEMEREEWDKALYCSGCENCDEGRIDGYVELEEVSPAQSCTCRSCGHQHEASPTVYKIPADKGQRV